MFSRKGLGSFLFQLVDSLWQGLIDQQIKTPMGITAENLAKKYEITREQCNDYAVQSAQRWKAGIDARFSDTALFSPGKTVFEPSQN